VQTLPEFFAHALAIEDEAAERYRELAAQMIAHHNEAVAEVFVRLAGFEAQHAAKIRELAEEVQLPPIAPWEYRWEGFESPESVPHDQMHYLMTPFQALELALINERLAHEFFVRIVASSKNPEIKRLAREMAADEAHHVELIREWLRRVERPARDWADDPDPASEVD
jgi:rubrerythrin